jgi:hypothetical protein
MRHNAKKARAAMMHKAGVPRCRAHGYECPRVDGHVTLHSHDLLDPKTFYCEASCNIGNCRRPGTGLGHG